MNLSHYLNPSTAPAWVAAIILTAAILLVCRLVWFGWKITRQHHENKRLREQASARMSKRLHITRAD